jgi:uncharacterized membrane protein YgdD (TMEM256/DUF423 family)
MSDSSSNDFLRRTAAFLGASGVFLGAIGAHALKSTLEKRGTSASWQTATIYQLFHATAILSIACNSDGKISPLAGKLMAFGTMLFSGSLYGLCLNVGPRKLLGPATPIGGLFMIGGWVVAGLDFEKTKES